MPLFTRALSSEQYAQTFGHPLFGVKFLCPAPHWHMQLGEPLPPWYDPCVA